MAHEARTRQLPPAPNGTAAVASRSAMDRVDGALEGLWRFLSSMRVAVILILLIAVLGVIGSLVIQAAPGVSASPAAKASWLAEIRPKFGFWTDPMDALGLFDIFNSVVFRALMAGLTISLVACSVQRFPGMWRTATKPRVDVGPAFFDHAPQHEAVLVRMSPADTLAAVNGVLRRHRYRVLMTEDDAVHIYADRFRWAPFAGLIGHLSLVVILLGAVVGTTFGYRDSGFTLPEGAERPVAAEPGLTIELIDFTDTYYITTGGPSDYASQVILRKDGKEIARHTIRVNDPLRYGTTNFYQAFFGVAAVMKVVDKNGQEVAAESVPLAWKVDGGRKGGTFTIPGTRYVGEIVGTAGSSDTLIEPGQMQVSLFEATTGSWIAGKVIEQGQATQVGDLTFTFEREAQFTGLSIGRDPGVLIVWIGSILLFVGFSVRFLITHKRVWARIAPGPRGGAVVGVASLGGKDVVANSDFDKLVSDIRTAVAPPAQS